MTNPEAGPAPPGRARRWFRRVLKLCAWGCGGTLFLFALLLWGLFAFLDRVPTSYPPAPNPMEPPSVDAYADFKLDGFESPYLGHTGSWDGKGGGMFGASKVPDLDWEVGMGLRWTFMPVYWSALEPNGPVDLTRSTPRAWGELDRFVVEAQKRRLNVLVQIVIGGNAGGPPKWAGRRESGKSAPVDMSAAAEFASKLVERYKPDGVLATDRRWPDHYGVRAWELDNEPNAYLTHWDGQAGDYAEFVSLAAAEMEKKDEHVMILVPATTGGSDAVPWLRSALGLPRDGDGSPAYRQRGMQYSIGRVASAISFHNYEGADSAFAGVPRTVERVFSDTRAVFEEAETVVEKQDDILVRDYWHTEGNFDFIGALSAERRAAWRLQFFTRAFAAGIRKVCVMDASKRDHAAVRAYVEALPWPFPMNPDDAETKVIQGQVTAFRHPDGPGPDAGVVWVVWAVAGTGDSRVTLRAVRDRVTIVHVDGSKDAMPATGGRVTLDLKGDKKMAPPVLVLDRPGS
jgi:hypothetical protein